MALRTGVAQAKHARGGRDGGFARFGHDKHRAVQAFATIGRVTSEAPYRVEQAMHFSPHRVDVEYLKDAGPAAIDPLLDHTAIRQANPPTGGEA